MALRGHLWTLGPRLRHGVRPLHLSETQSWQERVADPVAGPVRLTGRLRDLPGSEEIVVLVHGLGGSIDSHYVLQGAQAAEATGFSCLRINLRGSDRDSSDFYHAGLTSDLHAALASEPLRRYRRIYLLGYSLGGHVALRAATEEASPRLAAVAAVCSPLDLALSQREIDAPGIWLYRRYLLANLVQIYAAVARHRPVPLPVEQAARIRTLRDWDDRIVAPRHGFADAEDYYARASVAPRLPDLRIPSLTVHSEWDPMVTARSVRATLEGRYAPLLTMRWVSGGGHVGFPRKLDLGLGKGIGVDAQVLAWLRSRPGSV